MGTAVQPWGGVSSSTGRGHRRNAWRGLRRYRTCTKSPGSRLHRNRVHATGSVKRFQRFGQLGQVFGILAAQIVKIQRRFREAEALELVELRHHFAINHRNAAGNPPVRTLVAHKHQAVVQAGGKITLAYIAPPMGWVSSQIFS